MVDRRRLLEVLKWVPPEDNLSHTSLVSRLWFEASDNEEVWASLCSDFDVEPNPPEFSSLKETFRLEKSLFLPILSSRSLKMLNCRCRTLAGELFFQESLAIDPSTAAVMLPKGGLIACGGKQSRRTHQVTVFGRIQQLQPMIIPRSSHSAALLRGIFYVFGGNSRIRGAEKLKISSLEPDTARQWVAIPSPIAYHHNCQPCTCRALIYLCGGDTKMCEVFDTEREVYTMLLFNLPAASPECISFFSEGELVAISGNYICCWKPGANIQNDRTTYCKVEWTSMKHVLIGNSLYKSVSGKVQILEINR